MVSPFPHSSPLDNNYNYENVAMPRLMRIISELPRDIEVRSFYVETLSGSLRVLTTL